MKIHFTSFYAVFILIAPLSIKGVEIKIETAPESTNGVVLINEGHEIKFKAIPPHTIVTNINYRGYRWEFTPYCNPSTGSNAIHMVTVLTNALGTNFTVNVKYWGTVGSNSFYCEYGKSNIVVAVPGLELVQSNFPNLNSKIIKEGESAYITGTPEPPHLFAHLVVTNLPLEVKWELTNNYPRRGALDNKSFSKTLALTNVWSITNQTAGEFFGGNVALKAKIEGLWEKQLNFKILGKNPLDATAKAYIAANDGEFWFAWPIAQHESRQGRKVYNQFNIIGNSKEEPNKGDPDGWGIFQVDSHRGTLITTSEVWNWQTNVVSGIAEFTVNKNQAQSYFGKIQQLFPNQWEAPPAEFRDPGTNTRLTALEAATITLYNGASIIIVVRDNQIVRKIINGRLERLRPGESAYISSWDFNPNGKAGEKWKYIPNRNNYLHKVIWDEYEGHLPIQE